MENSDDKDENKSPKSAALNHTDSEAHSEQRTGYQVGVETTGTSVRASIRKQRAARDPAYRA